MPWWGWVLIGVVLFLAAAAVLTSLGLSLYRQFKALFRELGEASDRLSAVSAEIQELSRRVQEPAVFENPAELRQERLLSRRRERGSEKRRQRLR